MVSVIVPIYNVESYLEECLYSIANQSYQDIEIICVNDCTLDNSIAIVKKFVRKDSRFRLVCHQENKGLGGARNTGIEAARGEYLLFVDSDDAIAPDMIEALLSDITVNDSDVSVCGALEFYPDGLCIKNSAFHYRKFVSSFCKEIKTTQDRLDLTDMWPSAWNKLFKKSIIQKYHLRFPEKMLYEDHTFYYSYFLHVSTYSYINRPLYYYRKARPGSITSNITGRETEIFCIIKQIDDIFNSLFSSDPASYKQKAIMKISYRLLAERNYTLASNRKVWCKFSQSALLFLNKNYDLSSLKENIDAFYYKDDDFYRFIFSYWERKKFLFKEMLKSIPGLRRIVCFLLRRPFNRNIPVSDSQAVQYQDSPVLNPAKSMNLKQQIVSTSNHITLDYLQDCLNAISKLQEQLTRFKETV